MLNKIKSLVVVLVVVLVNVFGLMSEEPVVEEKATEEAATRLAAIEVAVADKEIEKCLDIDNLYFFVNGMTVAEAEEACLSQCLCSEVRTESSISPVQAARSPQNSCEETRKSRARR